MHTLSGVTFKELNGVSRFKSSKLTGAVGTCLSSVADDNAFIPNAFIMLKVNRLVNMNRILASCAMHLPFDVGAFGRKSLTELYVIFVLIQNNLRQHLSH